MLIYIGLSQISFYPQITTDVNLNWIITDFFFIHRLSQMLIYNWIITDFFSSTDVICENLLIIIYLWKSVDYFTTD